MLNLLLDAMAGCQKKYIDIHNWFDETKSWIPDNRHRAIRHHAEGIFQATEFFGETRVNSEGRTYHVRDIGEQHCREDFGGFIPCAADYLSAMESEPWMSAVRGTFPPSARKLGAAKRAIAESESESAAEAACSAIMKENGD